MRHSHRQQQHQQHRDNQFQNVNRSIDLHRQSFDASQQQHASALDASSQKRNSVGGAGGGMVSDLSDVEDPDMSFMTVTSSYTERSTVIHLPTQMAKRRSMPVMTKQPWESDSASGIVAFMPQSMTHRSIALNDDHHVLREPLTDAEEDDNDDERTNSLSQNSVLSDIEEREISEELSMAFGDNPDLDLSLIDATQLSTTRSKEDMHPSMMTRELQRAHQESMWQKEEAKPSARQVTRYTKDEIRRKPVPGQASSTISTSPSSSSSKPKLDRKASMIPSSSLAGTQQMAVVGTWGPSSKMLTRMSMDSATNGGRVGGTWGLKKNTAKAKMEGNTSSTRASIDEIFSGTLVGGSGVSSTTKPSSSGVSGTGSVAMRRTPAPVAVGTFGKSTLSGYLSIGRRSTRGWNELKGLVNSVGTRLKKN
jgi:hypothetical protein